MDWLWSPWRYRYVTQASPADACIFCSKLSAERDEENLIVHRGEHCFVLLNLYPYTSGHLMVAPFQHIADYDALAPAVANELTALTQESVRHVKALYRPQGLNVGMNLGECAGAGVAGHLHVHVLPRWPGDASFMTTIGETRVVPEALSESWRKLQGAFAAARP